MRKVLLLLMLLAVASGGWYLLWGRTSQGAASFKTAEVRRGDLLVSISATGTVEPEEVVDVGARISHGAKR